MYILMVLMIGSVFLHASAFRRLGSLSRPVSRLMGSAKGFSSSDSPLQDITDTLRSIKDMEASIAEPQQCEHLSKAMSLMSSVTLADVGLSAASIAQSKYSLCMDIVKTPSFHMAAFLLPQGHALPLHDHPDMAVLSKVIHGSLQVDAYSPVENKDSYTMTLTETRDETSQAWYLTPRDNNIHSFFAMKPCLILDILLPPYDEEAGRDCTFYELQQKEEGEVERYTMLPLKDYIPSDPVYNANRLYRGYKVS